MSELIHVGTVVRPRGNKGEVVVDCPGAHPERLVELDSFLLARTGEAPGAYPATMRIWLEPGATPEGALGPLE